MTENTSQIENGLVVTVAYTLRNDAGELLHHQPASDPLTYLHGATKVLRGLERELSGGAVGDKLSITLSPEDAFGERNGPGPRAVPRAAFSEIGSALRPGMPVEASGPAGQLLSLWVVEVGDESVMVDAEHPLVGQTLHFEVEILGLRLASEKEKAEGRIQPGRLSLV
jgi:FKBP-type peptidyl-prolyl cis-trans isomerase SlyD